MNGVSRGCKIQEISEESDTKTPSANQQSSKHKEPNFKL